LLAALPHLLAQDRRYRIHVLRSSAILAMHLAFWWSLRTHRGEHWTFGAFASVMLTPLRMHLTAPIAEGAPGVPLGFVLVLSLIPATSKVATTKRIYAVFFVIDAGTVFLNLGDFDFHLSRPVPAKTPLRPGRTRFPEKLLLNFRKIQLVLLIHVSKTLHTRRTAKPVYKLQFKHFKVTQYLINKSFLSHNKKFFNRKKTAPGNDRFPKPKIRSTKTKESHARLDFGHVAKNHRLRKIPRITSRLSA